MFPNFGQFFFTNVIHFFSVQNLGHDQLKKCSKCHLVRSTFDNFAPFLTPLDTLTNSALVSLIWRNYFGQSKFVKGREHKWPAVEGPPPIFHWFFISSSSAIHMIFTSSSPVFISYSVVFHQFLTSVHQLFISFPSVLHQFHISFSLILLQLFISSSLVLFQLFKASSSVLHQLYISSSLVPEWFFISSSSVVHQVFNSSLSVL